MSLWKKGFRRLGRRGQKSVSAEQSAQRQTEHICQIEALEPRRLLAFSVVPIHLGMVYGEYATQDDFTGNRFELTWDGGQPGTQLTELVINADKDGQGLSPGDCFFDIAEGGRGVYGWKGFEILENQGIDQVSVQVEDGGAVLRLSFAGFDPGDRLVFLIDVDEAGYWDGTAYHDNSKAEGAEFEGSWLTATFTAPHYYQATASSQFVDQYGTLLAGSGLSLPQDDLLPGKPDSSADLTAGGFLQLQQTPLPITLAGRVYEDANMNNSIDSGELGIAGVQLSLWRKEGDAYVDTGLRATTDALGYYRFEATSEVSLDPGVYRIVQTQPDGYLSVGAQPGQVGAETRGLAESPNVLTEIQLLGGDQSQENNFGEVRPASICGRIFADMNLDGAWQPGEPRLAGVTVQLLDADGHLLQTTATNSDGQYCFTGLLPGVYSVREIQPAGYLDGPDQVGSVGGYIVLPDTLAGIQLVSGAHGVEYNFSEILPGRLSGYVFQDGPTLVLEHGQPVPPIESVRDGQFTPDDTPLAGVSVQLWRDGILVAETTTDANGFFEFAMLQPGNYTLRQVQPAGYVDGIDTAGSLGGLADSHSDTISAISIAPGANGTNYWFSEAAVEWLPEPPPPPPPPPPNPPVIPPEPTDEGPFMLPPGPPMARNDALLPLAGQPFSLPTTAVTGSAVLEEGAGLAGAPTLAWHLSVINGGIPRQNHEGAGLTNASAAPFHLVSAAGWNPAGGPTNQGRWVFVDPATGNIREAYFGQEGSLPVVGDWNGDGKTEMGFYVGGRWYLDLNGNGQWDEADLWGQLGAEGDQPITGDWDGDGKTDIGIVGRAWPKDPLAAAVEPGLPDAQNQPGQKPKNMPPSPEEATDGLRQLQRTMRGKVRTDLIDHVFLYGGGKDQAVVGDWNGDGVATIGLFRDGRWTLDTNGNGRIDSEDQTFQFGQPGDMVVVGDWNGDGVDDLAVYRDGLWILDSDGDRQLTSADRQLRTPQGIPIAGDWNGDGRDEPAVYQPGVRPERGT